VKNNSKISGIFLTIFLAIPLFLIKITQLTSPTPFFIQFPTGRLFGAITKRAKKKTHYCRSVGDKTFYLSQQIFTIEANGTWFTKLCEGIARAQKGRKFASESSGCCFTEIYEGLVLSSSLFDRAEECVGYTAVWQRIHGS
jgi:hypothetical protein